MAVRYTGNSPSLDRSIFPSTKFYQQYLKKGSCNHIILCLKLKIIGRVMTTNNCEIVCASPLHIAFISPNLEMSDVVSLSIP